MMASNMGTSGENTAETIEKIGCSPCIRPVKNPLKNALIGCQNWMIAIATPANRAIRPQTGAEIPPSTVIRGRNAVLVEPASDKREVLSPPIPPVANVVRAVFARSAGSGKIFSSVASPYTCFVASVAAPANFSITPPAPSAACSPPEPARN